MWFGTPKESPANIQFINETNAIIANYPSEGEEESGPESTIPNPPQGVDDDASMGAAGVQGRALHLPQLSPLESPRISNAIPQSTSRLHNNDSDIDDDQHAIQEIDTHKFDIHAEQQSIPLEPQASARDQRPVLSPTYAFLDHTPVSSSPAITESQDLEYSDAVGTLCGVSRAFHNLSTPSPNEYLQAVLLRYFIVDLSHWFDVNDPLKHFARILPQRARTCPPLLHAILTASARHLTSLPKNRDSTGCFSWRNIQIPTLHEHTALHYHNECIKELLELSTDPAQIHNEDLLAAAIVLRFYEEIDSPLQNNGDKEVLLHVINIFVDAQIPAASIFPQSSRPVLRPESFLEDRASNTRTTPTEDPRFTSSIQRTSQANHPPENSMPCPNPVNGLRRAAFWIAFRQELYTSYMKQRPFRISLARCQEFRTFSPADNEAWTDRLVVFCADVLEHCYGSADTCFLPSMDTDRWRYLGQYASELSRHLPPDFEPLYYKQPDMVSDHIFPEVWYISACHATGIAHLELANMLLAVFDPTRPKWGHGYIAHMKALSDRLRRAVYHLCGTALHNRKAPTSFIDASMGISACGEYLTVPFEQDAVLEVLKIAEADFAWPTRRISLQLKQAWVQK